MMKYWLSLSVTETCRLLAVGQQELQGHCATQRALCRIDWPHRAITEHIFVAEAAIERGFMRLSIERSANDPTFSDAA